MTKLAQQSVSTPIIFLPHAGCTNLHVHPLRMTEGNKNNDKMVHIRWVVFSNKMRLIPTDTNRIQRIVMWLIQNAVLKVATPEATQHWIPQYHSPSFL